MYLLNGLQSLGALGPWIVFLIYIAAASLFISLPVLALAAGAMFGTWVGFLVFSLSSAVSAALMFYAARHFTRGWIHQKAEQSPRIHAVDDAVAKGGWRMVVLLRFTAILPYAVMNYGLGLSKISFREYLLATWAAMIPGALLQAYLGDKAGEMLFNGQKPQANIFEWVLLIVGIIASLILGIYATKRIKHILDNH